MRTVLAHIYILHNIQNEISVYILHVGMIIIYEYHFLKTIAI